MMWHTAIGKKIINGIAQQLLLPAQTGLFPFGTLTAFSCLIPLYSSTTLFYFLRNDTS